MMRTASVVAAAMSLVEALAANAAIAFNSNEELRTADPRMKFFNDCMDKHDEEAFKNKTSFSALDYRLAEDACLMKTFNEKYWTRAALDKCDDIAQGAVDNWRKNSSGEIGKNKANARNHPKGAEDICYEVCVQGFDLGASNMR